MDGRTDGQQPVTGLKIEISTVVRCKTVRISSPPRAGGRCLYDEYARAEQAWRRGGFAKTRESISPLFSCSPYFPRSVCHSLFPLSPSLSLLPLFSLLASFPLCRCLGLPWLFVFPRTLFCLSPSPQGYLARGPRPRLSVSCPFSPALGGCGHRTSVMANMKAQFSFGTNTCCYGSVTRAERQ